jgi:hypothetical protein
MIPHDEYLQAIRGNTPEMAFVYLESKYREKLNANLEGSDNSGSFDAYVIEYMHHTQAAARALGLDILDAWSVPSHSQRELYNLYKDFTAAVDQFKVLVQIENARSRLRYSVGLDSDEKDKLRTYVAEIKKVIDSSSLSQKKREQLYDLINAFLAEVDRDRAPWDRFADMVIGIAHLAGEAAQELEPARRLINSIARLLGRAKEFEDSAPRLPLPHKPRRIPGPPKELVAPSKRGDMDDEIPF